MEKKLSELTDQELLEKTKKAKTTLIINAVLIGFSIGIIFYSIMKNTLGLLTLIPLFIAYKLMNNSKDDKKEPDHHLQDRNLK